MNWLLTLANDTALRGLGKATASPAQHSLGLIRLWIPAATRRLIAACGQPRWAHGLEPQLYCWQLVARCLCYR
jgi:hypothetical protein